jgi:hypothetical protein
MRVGAQLQYGMKPRKQREVLSRVGSENLAGIAFRSVKREDELRAPPEGQAQYVLKCAATIVRTRMTVEFTAATFGKQTFLGRQPPVAKRFDLRKMVDSSLIARLPQLKGRESVQNPCAVSFQFGQHA